MYFRISKQQDTVRLTSPLRPVPLPLSSHPSAKEEDVEAASNGPGIPTNDDHEKQSSKCYLNKKDSSNKDIIKVKREPSLQSSYYIINNNNNISKCIY